MAHTKRNTALPAWDLSDLFTSPKDKRIQRTFSQSKSRAARFQRKYKGKLTALARSPKKFMAAVAEYSEILQEASKPVHYASLLYSESATESGRGAFLQSAQSAYSEISRELMFFHLEVGSIPAKTMKKVEALPEAAPYKNYFAQLRKQKIHRLSEREEQIMSDKALTGRSTWLRLFGEVLAEKEFAIHLKGARGKKKTKVVNESAALDTLHSPDRALRKAGAKALTEGFQELSPRTALIYNTLVFDKSINDRYRQYQYPEDTRHEANEIDRKMVDALVESVTGSYRVVQDFYRYKTKLLGYKKLYDYDRYAPLTTGGARIPYPKAKKLVLDAFRNFSEELHDIAALFFENSWVDVEKRPGKKSGAFCSFVTPDKHPYVFMNYSGSMRDVFTLAHELGHAVHAYLMRKHPYLVFDVPLTIAETASVFAEMLLFEHLTKTMKPGPQLFSLYITKIESIFATVYRQVSMFLFERDVHEARKQGELSTDQFNRLWRARQKKMFGNSVELTSDYDWWWSYIPHFMHTPFYVYAYAFGELLTLALYHRYHQEGTPFVKRYFELLAAGGTKNPKQLLRPFKVDLGKRDVWDDGVKVIRGMVRDVKRMR